MMMIKKYSQNIKKTTKTTVAGLAVGVSLALIANVTNPEKQSVTLASTSSCRTLSVGDKLPVERKQEVTHYVPINIFGNRGMNVVFTQGSIDGFRAFFLSRDGKQWRGATNELPKVFIAKKGNEIIFNWTPSGEFSENVRTTLVIQFPANSRLNHTIVPVGLSKRSLRAITYYPSKIINNTTVSPFFEIIDGLPKGVAVSKELNTILNEQTASGDILIPSVFRHEVKLHNLKVVSNFPSCN